MSHLELRQSHSTFGGKVGFYQHQSDCCHGPMRFSVYAPPQMAEGPVPVVYFLSGLTCTEENFMLKSGAQRYAADLGICLVAPDTSPRNTGIAEEDTDWTYGSGASFYLNATEAPWSQHYQMYRYVVEELPTLIQENFSVTNRQSIMGHSMGGHGALVLGLRNPEQYAAISAFAPITNLSVADWTQPALTRYLGEDQDAWKAYDATVLVEQYQDDRAILIDQGLADQFLEALKPEVFEATCERVGRSLTLRRHPGYDHGYFFIASFVGDHLKHHAQALL